MEIDVTTDGLEYNIALGNALKGKSAYERYVELHPGTTITEEEYVSQVVTNADYAKAQGDYARDKGALADTKATLADTKATYANTQGNYAKAQGDYAKSKGDAVDAKIGNMSNLETEHKDTLVNAINDAYNHGGGGSSSAEDITYDSTLEEHTAGSIAQAMADAENGVASASELAEGAVESIGDLSELKTTSKDTIVDAINEVNDRKEVAKIDFHAFYDEEMGEGLIITPATISYADMTAMASAKVINATIDYDGDYPADTGVVLTENDEGDKVFVGSFLANNVSYDFLFAYLDNGTQYEVKIDSSEWSYRTLQRILTDTDGSYGQRVKTAETEIDALSPILPYLESVCSYGVEFDTNVSSPTCIRIGNADLHRTLPIHSRMKGCLLDDDGNVVEYLNPSDWTDDVRDGSRGQVMVEIPMHYRKFETEGTKRRIRISEYPLAGYHVVPKRYVSAYQATVDRRNSKLASVRNFTAQYRGCGNQSEWDGTYRSALGKPATGISLTSYRSYARARKAGSTAWNCHTYGTQKALYWLFVVEYATLNSQAAFNAAKDASGYAQGGLGGGVTNADGSKWSAYNGYYPFIECGVTDSLGNGSGQVSVTVLNGDSTTFITTNVNRYRGVEIPFGHVWHWTDGVLVEAGANDDTNNLHKVFVASNPANFASSIGTGYAHVGNEARADGYGKEHIFGDGGEIIPAAVGGGSTTYLCDYHYQNIPASGKATRGVLFGGAAHDGAYAGFVFACSNYAPSLTYASFGSRLCFLPTTD